MACKITSAKAPNGQESKVFKTISEIYTAEVGLAAQLHIYSDVFIEEFGDWQNGEGNLDENGEPDWNEVLFSLNKHKSIATILEKAFNLKTYTGFPIKFNKNNITPELKKLNDYFKENNIPAEAVMVGNSKDGFNININVATPTVSVMNPLSEERKMLRDIKKANSNNDSNEVFQSTRNRGVEHSFRSDNRGEDVSDRANNTDKQILKDKNKDKKVKLIPKGHRFYKVLQQLELRRDNYNKEVVNLQHALETARKAEDIKEVTNIKKLIGEKKFLANEVQGDIKSVLQGSMVSSLKYLAKKDISSVEELLNKRDNFSINELQNMKQILNFWIESGRFDDPSKQLIFSASEMTSSLLKADFAKFSTLASDLMPRIDKRLKAHFTELIQEQYGKPVNYDDATQLIADISGFKASVLHIGHTDNMVLQSIYKAVKAANIRAALETKDVLNRIDDFMPEILKILPKEDPFEFFKQRDENGLLTGDLLTIFSAEFDRARDINYDSVIYNSESTNAQRKAAYKWKQENEIIFDVRKLFYQIDETADTVGGKRFTEADREAHIAELKRHLGDKMFDSMYKEVEQRINDYFVDKEAAEDAILSNSNAKPAQQAIDIIIWQKNYSPFYASKSFVDDVSIKHANAKTVLGKRGLSYTVSVPRKYKTTVVTKGKKKNRKVTITESKEETGYYDKKFEQVLNNDKLFDFWTFFTDTMQELNKFIPSDKRSRLKHNSIVAAEKSIQELFLEVGKQKGTTNIISTGMHAVTNKDFMAKMFHETGFSKELSRAKNYGTHIGNDSDPATGKQIRYVQASFIRDNKEDLENIVSRKTLLFRTENGREPTEEEYRDIRYRTLNELAEEKSYDLGKVLRTYALNAIAFKHKAAIEDKIHLAHNIFNEIREKITNNRDQQLVRKHDDKADKEGLVELKKMLDHFMDNFDNFKIREDEGVTGVDINTTAEKKQIAQIDAALAVIPSMIENNQINLKDAAELKQELEKQRDLIGGKLSGSGVGNQVMNFVQYKVMGWNLPGAVINLAYGQLANWIEAGSGRFFAEKSYSAGSRIVWSSMTYGKNSDDARKMNYLADNWGLLQTNLDIVPEANKKSWLGRAFDYVKPHAFGNTAEKMNQMPIAIAIMLDTKITDINGNESNLWAALDTEGKLKPEFRSDENIADWEGDTNIVSENNKKVDMIRKIQEIIINTHGNYNLDAPVAYKKKLWGRALGQFKSWFPEALYSRIDEEYYDSVHGMMRKGRYRSYLTTKNKAGEQNKVFGIPYLTGLIGTIELALEKLSFGFYNMKSDFSEVDLQNLKSNIRELQIILSLYLIMILMQGLKGDIPEEQKGLYMFTLNSIKKLISDLELFMNYKSMAKLVENPIASMNIVKDFSDISVAVIKSMNGDTQVKTGINEGMWRVSKEIIEAMPFSKQLLKLRTLGSKEYTSPGDVGDAFSDFVNTKLI